MINIISKIWGIITLVLAIICLLPYLVFFNWFIIVIAFIGIIIGAFATQNKGGMYLNIFAFLIAFFRLIIGGGIF